MSRMEGQATPNIRDYTFLHRWVLFTKTHRLTDNGKYQEKFLIRYVDYAGFHSSFIQRQN